MSRLVLLFLNKAWAACEPAAAKLHSDTGHSVRLMCVPNTQPHGRWTMFPPHKKSDDPPTKEELARLYKWKGAAALGCSGTAGSAAIGLVASGTAAKHIPLQVPAALLS